MPTYFACRIPNGLAIAIASGPVTLAGPMTRVLASGPNWQQPAGIYTVVTPLDDATGAAVAAWIARNQSNPFVANNGVFQSDADGNPT